MPRRILTRTADAEPQSAINRSAVTRKMERGAMNLKEEIITLQRIAIEQALKRTSSDAAQAARLLGEVGRGVARNPGGTLRAMMPETERIVRPGFGAERLGARQAAP